MREYLNCYGIYLIIEGYLLKIYLDGVVCVLVSGNFVVVFILCYDKLDNFWFLLMYELVYIVLYLDCIEIWYMDNLDVEGGDEVE